MTYCHLFNGLASDFGIAKRAWYQGKLRFPCVDGSADSNRARQGTDITESGIVVPKGSLQAENGLTLTNDHGQHTLDLSETLLRLGMGSRTELRIVIPNYINGFEGRAPASGFGDVALGVKQQLGPPVGRLRPIRNCRALSADRR